MPSRQQEVPYFPQPHAMDPSSMVDFFSFPVDQLNGFQGPDSTRVPQSTYYEAPSTHPEPRDIRKPVSGFHSPSVPSTESHVPGISSASGQSIDSASSSAIGSPYSATPQVLHENWVDTSNGLGLPGAVAGELLPNDYMGNTMDPDLFFQKKCTDSFVGMLVPECRHLPQKEAFMLTAIDPSLIQPIPQQPEFSSPCGPYSDQQNYGLPQPSLISRSPGTSPLPILENLHAELEQHPHPSEVQSASPSGIQHPPLYERRPSVSSTYTRGSQNGSSASSVGNDDENKEKGRCPYPECGRVFKDLKAHMLTHQSERPEKCPIITCEYHTKGFARKYDKNRHTLTHYKGTMVCGFCPGTGSPAEKSFNRADVFKRHLTSVHGVEQTPPNCRKKSSAGNNQSHTRASSDATGKCSTCSLTFSNPQDFYEHLDDCVLRVVQQEEPSEAINQQRLAEVDSDEEVKKTMEKHNLVDPAGNDDQIDDDNDDNDDYKLDDLNNESASNPTNREQSGKGSIKKSSKRNANPPSRPVQGKNCAVTKHSSSTQNITNSGKPRPVVSRRRNNRDFYPQSWGCPSSSMKTKKRVLCVFDGPRRLWKDEMMLDNEFEVRLKLPGGAGDGTNRDAYITDLDVETMKRAEGVFSATAEERGPWTDGPSTHLIGQPAMLLPGLSSQPEDEVDIDELMMS